MNGPATPRIVQRVAPEAAARRLVESGLPPVLARVYAGRGIEEPRALDYEFANLLPVAALTHAQTMAELLAGAIERRERLLIVADYDCDGATACAVGSRALAAFGAIVDHIVPNRFEYGYGLTPEIVRVAHAAKPADWLITVDNGIAAVDGVAEANRLGMKVLVTDHHLAGDTLPAAACIVNPNQPGCAFPSKHLAGVGVMFYVMLALRAELRRRGAFANRPEPNLAALLDLVALGTIADVVRLDANNRLLVTQGLRRMAQGRMQPGMAALFEVCRRDPSRASSWDLGFMIGPRLNAAGRLEDMALGIECLITEDPARAREIAQQLDALNRERRQIESGMQESALARLADIATDERPALSLYDPEWHQGVIGIVAGRLKDRLHRPVVAFARGSTGELKGSGRSIRALHLRDALDRVDRHHPGLLLRFGGHAAAAGVTIRETDFPVFEQAFEAVVRGLVSPADLEQVVETDGSLDPRESGLDTAETIDAGVWGQGFPVPLFDDTFAVERQRVVGERHLKLQLARGGQRFEAILFNRADRLPERIRAVYRLGVNEYNGRRTAQLTIEHWHPAR